LVLWRSLQEQLGLGLFSSSPRYGSMTGSASPKILRLLVPLLGGLLGLPSFAAETGQLLCEAKFILMKPGIEQRKALKADGWSKWIPSPDMMFKEIPPKQRSALPSFTVPMNSLSPTAEGYKASTINIHGGILELEFDRNMERYFSRSPSYKNELKLTIGGICRQI